MSEVVFRPRCIPVPIITSSHPEIPAGIAGEHLGVVGEQKLMYLTKVVGKEKNFKLGIKL